MVVNGNHGCCPQTGIDTPGPANPGGARSFLERKKLLTADRCPMPRIAPEVNRVHTIPLKEPLPLPSLQFYLDGDPPPDRGQTKDWPAPDPRLDASSE